MARLPTPPVSCFVLGFVFLYTFVSLLNSLTSGKTHGCETPDEYGCHRL